MLPAVPFSLPCTIFRHKNFQKYHPKTVTNGGTPFLSISKFLQELKLEEWRPSRCERKCPVFHLLLEPYKIQVQKVLVQIRYETPITIDLADQLCGKFFAELKLSTFQISNSSTRQLSRVEISSLLSRI